MINCMTALEQGCVAVSTSIHLDVLPAALLSCLCSYGFNWGDGFVTDPTRITNLGLSNPRSFFAADRTAATGYKTVLAPHTYGEGGAHAGALGPKVK